MKAKRVFIKNHKEVDQAISLSLKVPELELSYVDYSFRLESVSAAFLTEDNYINACISGREVMLKNDKKVWAKIQLWLE